ncbi:MAG: DJ-1/PfpI family protein [Bacteroidaceae bacterium]|nr:DJ-1/PfpI family protein [Bacteroidaceae bacterium]
MKKVYVFLAEGFEEIEALTPVDIMRRAELDVVTVSIYEDLTVVGAHGIPVMADTIFGLCDYDDAALLFLPGGMPGAANLLNCEPLCELLEKKHREGTPLAAICAAPAVLGELGLLNGRPATCYPGFEEHLKGAEINGNALIVKDGDTLLTGCGPAAAPALGFALVEQLCGREKADEIRSGMMFGRTLEVRG